MGPAPGVRCSLWHKCMERCPGFLPFVLSPTPRAGDRSGGKYVVFVIPVRQRQRAPCVAGGCRPCRPSGLLSVCRTEGRHTDARSAVQTRPWASEL